MPKTSTLIRMNVRLPNSTVSTLRTVAETNAVPMAALIRMLVVEWARKQREGQLVEERTGGREQ